MVDWKKKVMKHAAGDLDPDELLEAATFMQRRGAAKKAAIGAGFGAVGAVIASQSGKYKGEESEGSVASGFPKPPLILGLTPRRLLVWSQSQMSGRPKELLGSIPVASIAGFTVGDGKMARKVSLDFTDGSSIEGEMAKNLKPEEFAAAVAMRVG